MTGRTSGMDRIRSHDLVVLVVVAFALFMDYFLYGMVVPLTPQSPAGVKGESQLGLLYLAYSVGVLLFTPVCGILGDRVGRRRPMIWGVIAQAAAVALFWSASNFPMLLLARVLQGAASAATWTAGLALVAEHYVAKRVQMMGLAMMGSTAGSVLGPTLGGILYDQGGYSTPFAVVAVLVAIDACALTLLLPPSAPRSEDSGQLKSIILERSVLVAGLAVAMAAASWAIVEPLLPNYLERTAGTTAGTVGLLFTVSAITYGLMAPVVSWVTERIGTRKTVSIGMLTTAAVLPLLALAQGVIWAGAALSLVSIAYAFTLNPTSAELGDVVDRKGLDCYAAVYAVYNIAYSLGMMGTDAFAAALSSNISFLQALFVISALLVICAPIFLFGSTPPAAAVSEDGGCVPVPEEIPGEDSSCNT